MLACLYYKLLIHSWFKFLKNNQVLIKEEEEEEQEKSLQGKEKVKTLEVVRIKKTLTLLEQEQVVARRTT